MTIGSYLFPYHYFFILIPQFIGEIGISIVVSNMIAEALHSVPQYAGTASALIGFLRFLLAALCSSLVMAINKKSPFSFTLIILSCSMLSLACSLLSKTRKNLVIFLGEQNRIMD